MKVIKYNQLEKRSTVKVDYERKLSDIFRQAMQGVRVELLTGVPPNDRIVIIGEIVIVVGWITLNAKLNSPNGTMKDNHAIIDALTVQWGEKLFHPPIKNYALK